MNISNGNKLLFDSAAISYYLCLTILCERIFFKLEKSF